MATNLDVTKVEFEIYQTYQDVIAPLIATLEVLDSEYPIEIFNEIRSIFLHLSRYKVQHSEKDVFTAKRHVKRAILDCYKYICVSYAEKLEEFRVEYKEVNLNLADNGNFLPQLNKLDVEAREKLFKAKEFEIQTHLEDSEANDNYLYSLYEEAYLSYKEIDNFIKTSNEAIQFCCSETKKSDMINKASLAFGMIGCVVGVAGIIISILISI